MSSDRTNCQTCGRQILTRTADRNGGDCAPCAKKKRKKQEVARRLPARTAEQIELDTYLNASQDLGHMTSIESAGVPSDWMHVTSLRVTHGSLWAGDPCTCDGEDDGDSVEVPNGEYVIEAQGYDFDGVRVIGRARARLLSASEFSLGDVAFEMGTDSAMIAICDIRCIEASVGEDKDAFFQAMDDHNFQRFGQIRFEIDGEEINFAYVNSGFGDGYGPVYQLMSDSECIGIELDFLGDGEEE